MASSHKENLATQRRCEAMREGLRKFLENQLVRLSPSPSSSPGMTTWLYVSPKTTMMFTIPWPSLFFLLYTLLDKEPLTRIQGAVTNEEGSSKVSRTGTDHSDRSVNLDPNEKGSPERCPELEGRESGVNSDPKDQATLSEHLDEDHKRSYAGDGVLTWREKLLGAREIFPYIFFLFITYLAEYLSNHAVITTIAFPSSNFSPRDHYPYYLLSYHVGKFMGRSHFFIIHTFLPSVFPYICIRRTWILALIQVFHFVFLSLVAWYRFVTEAWVIILFCLTEGLTAGSMYVNSAHTVSEKIAAPGLREFALCILTVGNAFGKLTAGFLGLLQEPLIRKHCLEELGLDEYCFTRHSHHSAWEEATGWQD